MVPQRYSDRGVLHLEKAISARLPRAADRLADDRPPPILSTWNCAPPDGENRATPDRRSRSPRGLSRERPLVNDQRQIRSIPAIRGSAHDCKLVAYRVFGHMRERSKAKAPAAGHCCEKLRARASPERRRQDRYAQIQCFRQCCFERHIRFSPRSDRAPKVSPWVHSISPDFFQTADSTASGEWDPACIDCKINLFAGGITTLELDRPSGSSKESGTGIER